MSAAIQHKAGRSSEGSDFKSHVCSRNSDFCFIIMAKGSNIAQFLLSEIHRLTAILEIIYKHTSPHCNSLYCPLQILSFLFFFLSHKLKVCGNPVSNHLPNHVGLLCVSLSHVRGNIFIIIVFTMLICYQWSLMLLLSLFWGSMNHAQVRWWT